MNEPTRGIGGAYEIDPATGERRLIERTAPTAPEQPAPNAPAAPARKTTKTKE